MTPYSAFFSTSINKFCQRFYWSRDTSKAIERPFTQSPGIIYFTFITYIQHKPLYSIHVFDTHQEITEMYSAIFKKIRNKTFSLWGHDRDWQFQNVLFCYSEGGSERIISFFGIMINKMMYPTTVDFDPLGQPKVNAGRDNCFRKYCPSIRPSPLFKFRKTK